MALRVILGAMRFFHDTDQGPKPFNRAPLISTTHSANTLWRVIHGFERGLNSPVAIWGDQHGWRNFAEKFNETSRRGLPTEHLLSTLQLDYRLSDVTTLHWYLHPQRLDDLDLRILREFRSSARTGTQPDLAIVGHLPNEKIDEVMEGLVFEPKDCEYPHRGRGGKSVGPVQIALMCHAARLGVSPKATKGMFVHAMPASALGAMRRIFLHHYKPYYPEWDWAQNESSAQRALLRPRDPRFY